jgi:hypothetical protein
MVIMKIKFDNLTSSNVLYKRYHVASERPRMGTHERGRNGVSDAISIDELIFAAISARVSIFIGELEEEDSSGTTDTVVLQMLNFTKDRMCSRRITLNTCVICSHDTVSHSPY